MSALLLKLPKEPRRRAVVGKVSVNSSLPLRRHVSLYRALLLSTDLGKGVGGRGCEGGGSIRLQVSVL